MAESTEETIREALVAAIRGISAELGFDEVGGNVRDYLFEFEAGEDRSDSLIAQVDSEPRIRRWSVQVTAQDAWHATGSVMFRTYRVLIEALYELGSEHETAGGKAPVNELIDHARKVRGAIRGLGSMLGRRVDTMSPMTEISIAVVSGGIDPSDGELLRGTFGFAAEKRNPDF